MTTLESAAIRVRFVGVGRVLYCYCIATSRVESNRIFMAMSAMAGAEGSSSDGEKEEALNLVIFFKFTAFRYLSLSFNSNNSLGCHVPTIAYKFAMSSHNYVSDETVRRISLGAKKRCDSVLI